MTNRFAHRLPSVSLAIRPSKTRVQYETSNVLRVWAITLTAIVFGILTPLVANSQNQAQDAIDSFVEAVMSEFEVPGLSIAIVKDGQLIVTKGYGVKQLNGKNTPANSVDEHTLFGIASNTKAFTATALGLLVEEGNIGWDEPVINYLPTFRMSDPYVTQEMTIRDLLVHRSGLGLGAGDLMWWPPSDYDRKEIVRRLRYLPLETSFRSAYAYDNVLYSVAGEVIEAVSGETWEQFVQHRILDVVGMRSSNVLHSAAGEGGNVAAPHAAVDGTVREISAFKSDNTNPAGGINATANDIAKWMIVQLDSGRVAPDKRLFSPQTTRELWTIVTPIPTGDPPSYLWPLKTNFNGYALGFGVRDYRGKKLVTHTGGLPGFVSRLSLIPEDKIGVAVFTNQESGDAFNAISSFILDFYLEAEDFDWLAAFKRTRDYRVQNIARIEAMSETHETDESEPSLPAERYSGTYRDVWYGDVTIELINEKLVMQFSHTPSLRGVLEHHQHDTFVVRWNDRELRADAFITFVLTPRGTVASAKMLPASPLVDFSYDFQDLDLKRINQE